MKFFALILLTAACHGSEISDRFLDALAQVESGNNPRAVGKHGELGAYQIGWLARTQTQNLLRAKQTPKSIGLAAHQPEGVGRIDSRAAWMGVNAGDMTLGLATNPAAARLSARKYCEWLDVQLTRALKHRPTAGELYAAYNIGLKGFARRGNKLSRCPQSTRDAAKRLENLL